MRALPDWLDWLAFVLVPLAVLAGLTVMFFSFTLLANFIASPFNGLLAEAVELRLGGRELPSASLSQMVRDLGCNMAQGFLIAPPLNLEQATDFVRGSGLPDLIH